MVGKKSDKKEYMPVAQRLPFLKSYYRGTIYGKLHVWTHEKIFSKGWLDYEWWDYLNNDILVDMREDFSFWQDFIKFRDRHKDSLKWEHKEGGARLWWKAHNNSLIKARKRNDSLFRLMPYMVQEQSGLMIEGALSWQVDGLRPWKIPPKWIQIFLG